MKNHPEVGGKHMDYDLNAEASALKTLVMVAANELIESYENVDSGVMPKNQHRLAHAVYAFRRFRVRSEQAAVRKELKIGF